MKKYLYLLFVALFATLSFSLTSCGDDDDEPNGGSSPASSSFTIDGVSFGTNKDWAWVQNFEYRNTALFQAQLSTSKGEYPWIEMHIDTKAVNDSSKGKKLEITSSDLTYFTTQYNTTTYDEEVSGNVIVQDVNSSAVTLKFENYKLSDGSKSIVLNGVLEFDLSEL